MVDETSLELIKGSTIEYVQEMVKSAFEVVNNPQSVSECNCKLSFTLKESASNFVKD